MALFCYLFFIVISGPENDFQKAENYFKAEKYELAKTIFESIVKENPKNLKAIEYLGDIAGHYQNWDDALFFYEKLKKANPNEADYFYKYGGALGMKAKDSNKFVALGMIGAIRTSFEKAIILNPKHLEARWALIELYLQLPGIVGGSEKKANEYAAQLAKLSPVDGLLATGHIDEYFNRFQSAEKNYLKAHEIGNSKTTFQKLYNLYLNKLKDKAKATKLKEKFNK
ncbi:tetratricopeptide repeat protein [Flavobacterium sp.]